MTSVKPALSLHLVNFAAKDPGGWQHMFDRALAAEAAGIDRVTVSDHVVFGERLEEYGKAEVGGMRGSKQPTGPDGHWLEPMTVLSVIAGMTKKVRLGTGVLQAALRRPIVLAKTCATLDVLSGGRLDLGIGVGWQREEYEAAGLSFDGRGPLLDDCLDVLQGAWRDVPTSHSSEFLTFDRIYCVPKPLQEGGVPIWVSGTINNRTLRRIARFGSAWIPWGDDIRDPSVGLARIAEVMAEAGRDMEGFRTQGSLMVKADDTGKLQYKSALENVAAQVAGGITDFAVTLPLPTGLEPATEVLSELVAEFQKALG
ncbi:MAG: class F420-dependent oxidoreductase [Mycobacterium sp.]|nr:class F420-dependent oxidoreductase [Mycobacterium sp.]